MAPPTSTRRPARHGYFPTTVLVVEDELLIRMDVVDQLQTEGFQTLEAGTGREALHQMEGDRQIDIVFTDVDMPGNVNGIVLAHEVREKWPSVGIIVTSGQAVISVDTLPAGAHFFSKPYEMKAIFAIIQELIA
ncbi:response regulator [Novosphingobium marinum]|uniref:response regulator n=1 Tax=Novosphingobium marinum TaxID=1514948 RepID=UPI00227B7C43|nr:response regulator [Novosphingobium marinum]